MNVLILIPARYASTRFPGKPLAEIGGKPVIQHVLEKAQAVTKEVFVATDDDRIFNRVQALGGECVLTSASHKSGTDRCYEAYCRVAAQKAVAYDVVVNIQGDEPFIQPEQVKALISCFENPEVEIATLAKKFDPAEDVFDPNKVKVVFSEQQAALYFSRFPIPFCRGKNREEWQDETDYYKHIGMYAYRPAVLQAITSLPQGRLEKAESLEQLRWLENGYKIAVRITPYESLGIDTPEDLKKANEMWLKIVEGQRSKV